MNGFCLQTSVRSQREKKYDRSDIRHLEGKCGLCAFHPALVFYNTVESSIEFIGTVFEPGTVLLLA